MPEPIIIVIAVIFLMTQKIKKEKETNKNKKQMKPSTTKKCLHEEDYSLRVYVLIMCAAHAVNSYKSEG